MKAILNLDQFADLDALPPEYQSKISFVLETGRETPSAIFPKGTIFEGAHALHLVKTGQASPADDECAAACGMNQAQITVNNRKYAAAMAGIKDKKDLAMFMAGAIEGYGPGTTDEKPVYVKGPNWEAWQAATAGVVAESVKDSL